MSDKEIQAAAVEQQEPIEGRQAHIVADLGKPLERLQRTADQTSLTPDARHFVEEYLPDLHSRLAGVSGRAESKDLVAWMHEQAKQPDGHLFRLLLNA